MLLSATPADFQRRDAASLALWLFLEDGATPACTDYTQPEKEHRLLLATLKLQLPEQSPPRITANGKRVETNTIL
jgi:hypothetical protein